VVIGVGYFADSYLEDKKIFLEERIASLENEDRYGFQAGF